MATSVRMYDSGVVLNFTIRDEAGAINLTGAQLLQISFQRPDGSVFTNNCNIVTATTGQINYVSSASDFNQAGRWSIQITIQLASGDIKHTNIGSFIVIANLA